MECLLPHLTSSPASWPGRILREPQDERIGENAVTTSHRDSIRTGVFRSLMVRFSNPFLWASFLSWAQSRRTGASFSLCNGPLNGRLD